MQTVAVTAADHQSSGELVNDDDLVVLVRAPAVERHCPRRRLARGDGHPDRQPVTDPDRPAEGERLAKRHNSLRLTTLRESGVAPEQVIGWLAWLAGLQDIARPAKPSEFLSAFDFSRLPKENIILGRETLPDFIP